MIKLSTDMKTLTICCTNWKCNRSL